MATLMNVNVMRTGFRSLFNATNNAHIYIYSGRSYSKKGIVNKYCCFCFFCCQEWTV